MKNTRKLIPALAMLVLSAVLMSTASFAWFSMNNEVTATGIQLSATTDSSSLYISTDKTVVSDIRTQASGEVTLENVTGSILPSAHQNLTATSTVEQVQSLANWYYGYSNAANSSTIVDSSKSDLTGKTFADYVKSDTVYLAVAANSALAEDLVIDIALSNGADTALQAVGLVVVVTSQGGTVATSFCDNNTAGNATTYQVATGLDLAGTDTAPVQVDIFVYYNGNHQNVKTDNLTALANAKVDFTFSINGGN